MNRMMARPRARIVREWLLSAIFLAAAAAFVIGAAQDREPAARFQAVRVYLDPGERPLAAYQLEFKVERGRATIAGVEGGEHPAFRSPPYYDPAALAGGRIIIAAFSTAKELPAGKTCAATLHLMVEGNDEPEYSVRITTAAAADGREIPAAAAIEKGNRR